MDGLGQFELSAGKPARLFVRSETLAAVYCELPALGPGEIEEIILPGRPTLSFRVTVNGEAPGEAIAFTCFGGPLMDSIDSGQSLVRKELKKLGFPLPRTVVECTPEGQVAVLLPELVTRASLYPQDGFVTRALMASPGAAHRSASFAGFGVQLSEPGTQVDLLRLPSVFGRLVWEDTREAYTEEIFFERQDPEGYSIGGSVTTLPSSEGSFRVPLYGIQEVYGDDWLRLSNQSGGIKVEDVITERAVSIRVAPFSRVAASDEHTFSVPPDSGDIHAGEISVRRVPTVNVLTLGRVGGQWQQFPQ
ncbi:MAG: hypothetical protein ACJA2W_002309, partial [Planctomycetota bacterium]